MTPAEALAKIKRYLDDEDGKVVTSQAVADDALLPAYHAIYLQAVTWAPQKFMTEAEVTTSSTGAANLAALDPVRIVAVNEKNDRSRFPIPAAAFSDGPTNIDGVRTLRLTYIPAITYPAVSSNNFVWGQSSLDLPILDELLALHAASHLSMILDEDNRKLEDRIKVLEEKAHSLMSFSPWKIMPLRGRSRDSGLAYLMTDAVTLQIVRV